MSLPNRSNTKPSPVPVIATFAVFCALAIPVLAKCPGAPETVTGRPDQVSPFPASGIVAHTDKLRLSVTNRGILGDLVEDQISAEEAFGLEFPAGSNLYYLDLSGLWIGGILGKDTLVSTTIAYDMTAAYEDTINSLQAELAPPDAFFSPRSITRHEFNDGWIYGSELVDTFDYLQLYYIDHYLNSASHSPLHLSVAQKIYTKNEFPFKNIALLDYIITNIGVQPISHTYVGLHVDAAACHDQNPDHLTGVSDDLIGSFRDLATAYVIDNNGDPGNGSFGAVSPIDALGVRPVSIYPPAVDTNFNWWLYDFGQKDFGPRQNGTDTDPFFPFEFDLIGLPPDDRAKYYVMSHKEWDYDQVFTFDTPIDDTNWTAVDSSLAFDVATGDNPQLLLSLGPADLLPDSSIRVVFALFGGDFVHTDPLNGLELYFGRFAHFYENLYWALFNRHADLAAELAQSYLSPSRPPVGLEVTHMNLDTAMLKWDPRVYSDIEGYNLYIKEIPESFL